MRKCPITGNPMVQDQLEGVTIDRSEAGIWLDRAELLAITQAERSKLNVFDEIWRYAKDLFAPDGDEDRGVGATPRDLACPVCGKVMFVDFYQEVSVDRCREHGVWLDRGELELILARLRKDPEFVRGMTVRIRDAEL